LPDGLEALDGRGLRLLGTPYDEWDAYRQRYRRDFVRVVELRAEAPGASAPPIPVPPITPTRTRTRHRWDGELDIDAVVAWRCDLAAGTTDADTPLFTSLAPVSTPAVWCLLVDGSASSWAGGGEVFRRALACADATAAALSGHRQTVGVYSFRSFTRERVELRVLKGYDEPYRPLGPGPCFGPDGYTRLGAAIRHTGRRLRERPGPAHVLLSFGDGLPSDEGYDGTYAKADVAKAVEEQRRAGTLVAHVAVAAVEAARLDEMFGPGAWAPATTPTDLGPLLADTTHALRRPT
jgi:nitric oxide reductase activation protein